MVRRNLWLLVLGVLSLALIGIGGTRSVAAAPTQQAGGNMDHLSQLTGKDFEVMFLSMMIEHHQSALDMAQLVPSRAQHAEVKTSAQNIITSQSKEIREMTAWLKAWYNQTPQKGMMTEADMPGMDMAKLQTLQGDAFDQEFLMQMRVHHASAVQMAALVPARATHQELKDLAQNIITSQNMEIAEMAAWLKAWYGIDVAQPGAPTPVGDHMGGSMGGNMGNQGTVGMPSTGGPSTLPFFLLLSGLAGVVLLVGGLLLVRQRTSRG